MIEDHLTLKLRYERFVKKVCETKLVYALASEEGFATSSSNDYEDDDDNPVSLICFWSESTLASSCIQSGWENHKVSEIVLTDFIENWCVGMSGDGLLIGINFDATMLGFEVEPNEMLLDLISELHYLKDEISLKRYKNLSQLEEQIKKVMG